MDECYIGEIRLVAFSYDPQCWAACDGRKISVSENAALYSLLGCNFGGDGRTNFNLPKLDSPMKGLHYIICMQGLYPMRP